MIIVNCQIRCMVMYMRIKVFSKEDESEHVSIKYCMMSQIVNV